MFQQNTQLYNNPAMVNTESPWGWSIHVFKINSFYLNLEKRLTAYITYTYFYGAKKIIILENIQVITSNNIQVNSKFP